MAELATTQLVHFSVLRLLKCIVIMKIQRKVHSCIGGECGVLYVLGVVNELKF